MSVLTNEIRLDTILGYTNTSKPQTEPIYLGTVHVTTNYDNAILDSVTWFPHPAGYQHNRTGRGGHIEGTVRSGYTESRLFGETNRSPWQVGNTRKIDSCHLDDFSVHQDDDRKEVPGEFDYRKISCG